MLSIIFVYLILCFQAVAGQQIWDVWQTTWDRQKLLTSVGPNAQGIAPINFTTPGAIGSADIVVNDGTVYQPIDGFGATFTDSSAKLLSQLKTTNLGNYNALLNNLFSVADGAATAGFTYLRVTMAASDFSANTYTWDDTSGDTALSHFAIANSQSYFWTVLADIVSVQPGIKLHFLPWTPPAWMKTSGNSFNSAYVSTYANYFLKALQQIKAKGFSVYALSIQNEPQNFNPTYPTCLVDAPTEAQIGIALRALMNSNGFTSTNLVGFEHNWSSAGSYPITLMQDAPNAFSGVSFHCYGGSVSDQLTFHNAYPNKEIYFMECTGTLGSNWWSDIKWYIDNLAVGATNNYARSALMWNIVLDGNGQPILPGSNSCGGGCRGVAQVNGDGSYSLNQEYYAFGQASRAIIPKDPGEPFGSRIGVSVGSSLSWALIVGAYKTTRTNPSDWNRYSIVVLNQGDSSTTTWNPQPVAATIEFRGLQAKYTFPVGVTTLWWFAPN